MNLSIDDLIYNWGSYHFPHKVTVFDTTLRDGLQSTQANRQPTLTEKIAFLHACHEVGIDAIELGFPVSSESHKQEIIALAKYARKQKMRMLLSCLARTTKKDVETVIDASQQAGIGITVNMLIGSSNIRKLVENWDLSVMKKWIDECIDLAGKYNLPVEFVTEDTLRSEPSVLKDLYQKALAKGVKRIWIADTVGTATPESAKRITEFFIKQIIRGKHIGLDWHGHDDKGLGTANALAAAEAGVDRIQATALGIGERAGNTSMEQVILNLVLANKATYALHKLHKYSEIASKMFHVPIREGFPGIGKLVHSTAAGMHAAAILKGREMKREDLVGIVYGPFHPRLFGKEVEVLIGPMSGAANVQWNLERLNIPGNDAVIAALLSVAKDEQRFLTDAEITDTANNVLSHYEKK